MSTLTQTEAEDLQSEEDMFDSQLPEEEPYDPGLNLDDYHAPVSTDLREIMAAGHEGPTETVVTEETPGSGFQGTAGLVPDAASSPHNADGSSLDVHVAHTGRPSCTPVKIKEEPEEDRLRIDLTDTPSLLGKGTVENPFVVDDDGDDVLDEDMNPVGTGPLLRTILRQPDTASSQEPLAHQPQHDVDTSRQPYVEEGTPELQPNNAPHAEQHPLSPNTDAMQLDDQHAHNEEGSMSVKGGAQADVIMQDSDGHSHLAAASAGTCSVSDGTSPVAALNLGHSILKTPNKTSNLGNADIQDKVLQAQQAVIARRAARRGNEGGTLNGEDEAAAMQSRAEPSGTDGREIMIQNAEDLDKKAAAA